MDTGKPFSDSMLLQVLRSDGPPDEAIRQLYRSQFAAAKTYINRNNGNNADAEEIFQEVVRSFIRLVKKDTFREESSIAILVHAITRHAWLNELKKRGHTRKRDIKEAMEQPSAARQQLVAELENLRLKKESGAADELKKNIATIHTAMMPELNGPAAAPLTVGRKILSYSLPIVAVLVLGVGIDLMFQYYSVTSNQLYRSHYETFRLPEISHGAGASPLEASYKKGDAAAVMNLFNGLPHPQMEDYFLEGNASLDIHPEKAIAAFLAIQEKNKRYNTHFFEADTEYYLALACLHNNQPVLALPLLEKIYLDKDHPYHGKLTGWFMRKLRHVSVGK